jgi:hypothetical protein
MGNKNIDSKYSLEDNFYIIEGSYGNYYRLKNKMNE